ncbi:family 2A encapsulin nanocompartment cargo protein cysteine desulfurase [Treponema primitia]|uniref:family 2A encapsulin nanocompartment cargo protein cysteine desulfurase n=1 Tax=Treponema primitia TaxID=88058 RepID=UPI0002555029|nr:family 2A encapsulin nanocompartment cargo protein cysteine desulfurase [Treponema primitia]
MITPSNGPGVPGEYDPLAAGLPSSADIAALAAAYFPEFAAPAAGPEAAQAAGYLEQAAAAALPKATQSAITVQAAPPLGGALTPADYLRVLNESLDFGAVLGDPASAVGSGSAGSNTAAAAVEYAAGYAGGIETAALAGAAAYAAVADSAVLGGAAQTAASAGSFAGTPSAAYAPRVLSKDNPFPEACPSVKFARAAGILPPVSQEPGKSIYVGSRDLSEIRKDFPILSEKINGRDLVWLDNAATTQKPRQVIDRLTYFYEHENSNVHRGAHELAARSTDAYEDARGKVARFLGAPSKDNIVFVRGTTEGINLVAQAYVKQLLSPGDEIILTMLEHHANIVPWQLIAQETGAVIRVAPIDKLGQIVLSEYSRLFNGRTKFVAATQVSNALGTIAPVAEMIHIAHAQGVRVLIDGAQSVSHMPVNVTALDADFFVLSGHKIFAPTGIGALYGKAEVLEAARPYQGGGNMIADVTFERTLYQAPPDKFEAGTGNIADAVGLGAALDYVSAIGIANIGAYEHELVRYGMTELAKVPGLRLIGTAPLKASVLSFVLEGYENEEVGKYLNTQGIAVRAGHHCAQPVLRNFGLEGTVRPSVAFYNTPGEIDALVRALFGLVRR